VVTKSGTNQIHGDLFEFVRNGDFNARISSPPPRIRCGATNSGHGGRAYQEGRVFGSSAINARSSAPPAAIHQFRAAEAAAQRRFQRAGIAGANLPARTARLRIRNSGQPFPNDQVPTSRFSPQALNLA